jgi:hypothetical protein
LGGGLFFENVSKTSDVKAEFMRVGINTNSEA